MERACGLFFDATVPGVDDGVGLEGALVGRKQAVHASFLNIILFYVACHVLRTRVCFLCLRKASLCRTRIVLCVSR